MLLLRLLGHWNEGGGGGEGELAAIIRRKE